MPCQFIADWEDNGQKVMICKAFVTIKILTKEELEKRCQTSAYTDCKIYKAKFEPRGGLLFTGKRIIP